MQSSIAHGVGTSSGAANYVVGHKSRPWLTSVLSAETFPLFVAGLYSVPPSSIKIKVHTSSIMRETLVLCIYNYVLYLGIVPNLCSLFIIS